MPLDKKTLLDAVKEAKAKSGEKKFTQSIELILDIKEVDVKSPEGRIQQVIELPHVTGKPNKILVIASGELALNARKAKVDKVMEKSTRRLQLTVGVRLIMKIVCRWRDLCHRKNISTRNWRKDANLRKQRNKRI